MKRIALTFDDGPAADTTPAILDLLKRYHVPASFFVLGQCLTDETAPIVRRACALGCEICTHSFSHSDMTRLSAAEITREMDETALRIEQITGQKPRFFRPPYIAVNETLFETVRLPFVEGYGARDFDDAVSAQERYDRIMSKAKDGAVILLHDMEQNIKTVQAVSMLIPALLEAGYTFVTMTGLFADTSPQPRILYSYAAQTAMYAEDIH